MKKFHYAWIILAMATLILFCNIGLTSSAFSVYQPYLIRNFGLSNTQGSLIVTIRTLFTLPAMFICSWFFDKMGLRKGLFLTVLSITLAFLLFAVAQNDVMVYIAAAVAGFGYGLGGMIPVTLLITRWFDSNRALALGICTAGTGVCAMVVPPIFTLIAENISVTTAFWGEVILTLICAALALILLRSSPSDMGIEAYQTEENENTKKAAAPKLERTDFLRGKTSVLFMIVMVLIGGLSGPGFSHIAVLMNSEGFAPGTVSLMVSGAGCALMLGKLTYGRITDRIGSYRSNWLFFGILILGLILTCLTGLHSVALGFAALFVLGFGLPLATVGQSVWLDELNSPETLSKKLQSMQIIYMGGTLVFSPVPGIIADKTGTYVPAYALFLVFAVGCMLIIQTIYRKKLKESEKKD